MHPPRVGLSSPKLRPATQIKRGKQGIIRNLISPNNQLAPLPSNPQQGLHHTRDLSKDPLDEIINHLTVILTVSVDFVDTLHTIE